MENITQYFYKLLVSKGVSVEIAEYLNALIGVTLLLLFVYIINNIVKKIVLNLFRMYASKSKNTFDDYLVKNKTFDYISHSIPLALSIWIVPYIFYAFPSIQEYLQSLFTILIIVLIIWTFKSILRTFRDFLKSLESFRDKPIDSYVQVFMIFAWFIGLIMIFSTITGKSVWTFFTALGALSAVILLIFKDTILGFVASIQVSVNDTVRIGDWITMDKYGADGDVIEINLSSVKVQNFDKTITTIPTYHLTSESFRNWRGMMDSGGRRIKRGILIKASSIRFLSDGQIEELKKIELISSYIETIQSTIQNHNTKQKIDKSILINGRNLSNMGVFRKYVEIYLETHPDINNQMTIMSRQLAPTPQGTPLEIYAFSNDKRWKNYENIVSDIFEHLLASLSYFDLELFELEYNPKK